MVQDGGLQIAFDDSGQTSLEPAAVFLRRQWDPRTSPPATIRLALDPSLGPEAFNASAQPAPEGGRRYTITGGDARGAMFGGGALLRRLRAPAPLGDDLHLTGRPTLALRGHQLGYRPMNNTCDAWDVAAFDRCLREMIVFGCNAVELVSPRSEDKDVGPLMTLPPREMLGRVSGLCAGYGLDVWVWQPLLDCDMGDDAAVDRAAERVADELAGLPRLDAVFIPGGDPGHVPPGAMMRALQRLHGRLIRTHPRCAVWMSPQEMSPAELRELRLRWATLPDWLGGVVYGPWVHVPLGRMRQMLPGRYPIRAYPDITHTRECQFPVPRWDWPFAFTQGREITNPRPHAMQRFFEHHREDTIGFITYSEGAHDDVSKFIWSGLAWEGATLEGVLRDYAAYFLDASISEPFVQGLMALEANWTGPLAANEGVEDTLARFESMAATASDAVRDNWRFQLARLRANFDAYVRRRLLHEQDAQWRAMTHLGQAASRGTATTAAMTRAAAELDDDAAATPAAELRQRCVELGDAMRASIGLQLSVERHGASGVLRGACLDEIDVPLNDRLWLRAEFDRVAALPDEPARRAAIRALLQWTDPGPGGRYDDLGDPWGQPHLVFPARHEDDPFDHQNPAMEVGLVPTARGLMSLPTAMAMGLHEPLPLAWCRNASALHGQPLQLTYDGLDDTRDYRVAVVYASDQRRGPVRLSTGDGREVHPWLDHRNQRLTFDLPRGAVADGRLTLCFEAQQPRDGGYARRAQVAQVWLEVRTPR